MRPPQPGQLPWGAATLSRSSRSFLPLLVIGFTAVECLYFPKNNTSLELPATYPLNRPFFRSIAAINDSEPTNGSIFYAVQTHKIKQDSRGTSPKVEIGRLDGKLYLISRAHRLNLSITATLMLSSGEYVDNATAVVVVHFRKNMTRCTTPPLINTCFPSSNMDFRVIENSPPQALVSVREFDDCQNYVIDYSILKPSLPRSFHISEGVIGSNLSFDRETNSVIEFSLLCTIISDISTWNFSKDIKVTVEDVNDRAAKFLEEGMVIEIKNQNLSVGSKLILPQQIFVLDKDSSSSLSNYKVEIIGDEKHFFTIKTRVLPFRRATMEIDVLVNRILDLPDEFYNFSIVITDLNMAPKYGKNQDFLQLAIRNRTAIKHQVPGVSPVYNIVLPTSATRYSRILGPLHIHLEERPDLQFTLKTNDSKAANIFAITPTQGIVYLRDPLAWRTSSLTDLNLQVSWNLEVINTTSTVISIRKEMAVNKKFWNNVCNSSCAEHFNESQCESSCAMATRNGSCSWLSNSLYSTCSTELTTCPNKECDELEGLHWKICPQDCSYSSIPEIPPSADGVKRRGIQSPFGICTCDPNIEKCKCQSSIIINQLPKNYSKDLYGVDKANETFNQLKIGEVSTKPVPAVSNFGWCEDASCIGYILIITIGSILFLVFVIIIIVKCIKRRKGRKPKFLGSSNSLSAIPSDYVDDRSASGVSQGIPTITETMFSGPIKIPQPIDARWEFPRNQIFIEQTLGEGEFGKVVKAKAFGIDGKPGYSTVAVKMLKSNGTSSELKDLLSEFNLLKEVSHINVIKLLGACTNKGGPLYIIVEYAEYGSLRTFLRRTRHFDYGSEDSGVGSLTPSSQVTTPYVERYQVTYRDLMSFMWQISKGMAYLSEMKLVHRDLAARNVLLATGKVIKISDFGLSRDVYEGDTYFKTSKGRVPVKWMAIESLVNHVYTTKSDVWSFGIVMWEIMTLGSTPYPGVMPERLYHLLKSGYRMERPENCSTELYGIMLSCCRENAHERPSFKELTLKFDRMLQEDVEYLDLSMNLVHNLTYFESLHPIIPVEEEDSQNIHYGSLNFVSTDSNEYLTSKRREDDEEGDSSALRLLPLSGSHVPDVEPVETASMLV